MYINKYIYKYINIHLNEKPCACMCVYEKQSITNT